MRYIFFLLILSSYQSLSGQDNLIANPSFEDYRICPKEITHSQRSFPPIDWYLPTNGSTDYYNSCSYKKNFSTPNNKEGYQVPKNGNGYIFIVNHRTDLTEYVQSKLKEPLIKDSSYYIEFSVSLAESSTFASRRLGAYFSKDEFKLKQRNALPFEPQILTNDFISDTLNWVKVQGVFKAKGGEEFITIGCFHRGKKDFIKTGFGIPSYKSARYYIDDVKVVLIEDTIEKSTNNGQLYSNNFVLQNVHFNSNETKILNETKPYLNRLADYIKNRAFEEVVIIGHTDSVGVISENIALSLNRAESIKSYLIVNGIPKETIKCVGKGSSEPIMTNDTELGRSKNRRIEIKIK